MYINYRIIEFIITANLKDLNKTLTNKIILCCWLVNSRKKCLVKFCASIMDNLKGTFTLTISIAAYLNVGG